MAQLISLNTHPHKLWTKAWRALTEAPVKLAKGVSSSQSSLLSGQTLALCLRQDHTLLETHSTLAGTKCRLLAGLCGLLTPTRPASNLIHKDWSNTRKTSLLGTDQCWLNSTPSTEPVDPWRGQRMMPLVLPSECQFPILYTTVFHPPCDLGTILPTGK